MGACCHLVVPSSCLALSVRWGRTADLHPCQLVLGQNGLQTWLERLLSGFRYVGFGKTNFRSYRVTFNPGRNRNLELGIQPPLLQRVRFEAHLIWAFGRWDKRLYVRLKFPSAPQMVVQIHQAADPNSGPKTTANNKGVQCYLLTKRRNWLRTSCLARYKTNAWA